MRGDKKRAKRDAKETYFLVVNGEVDRGRAFGGRANGTNSIMEDAVCVAKKAWSQNKKELLNSIVIEHEGTGTRYTFDPRQWCNANGKSKFAEGGQSITPLRVSTKFVDGAKHARSQRRAGFTQRLRNLEVPSMDTSDASRLRNST